MCFKPKQLQHLSVPVFKLNGKELEMVIDRKYLGVIITDDLRNDSDIKRQIKSVYVKGNVLVRKFSKCTAEVKARLFKAYCSSFYCDSLWCNYYSETYRKSQTSYNIILRKLSKLDRLNSISEKCLHINVDCLKVLLRKDAFSFRDRIFKCQNDLVKCLTMSTYFISCSLTEKWNDLLFKFKQ